MIVTGPLICGCIRNIPVIKRHPVLHTPRLARINYMSSSRHPLNLRTNPGILSVFTTVVCRCNYYPRIRECLTGQGASVLQKRDRKTKGIYGFGIVGDIVHTVLDCGKPGSFIATWRSSIRSWIKYSFSSGAWLLRMAHCSLFTVGMFSISSIWKC